MQTVVVEDYPAERLPPDLRSTIDPSARVRVTVAVTSRQPGDGDLPARWSDLIGSGARLHGSPEEVVAAIRALRDEWD